MSPCFPSLPFILVAADLCGRLLAELWHGAFPKQTPGLRISVANYFRHQQVQSQEDLANSFDQSLANNCDDPELFRQLAGFAEGPYGRDGTQSYPLPTVAAAL